MKKMKSVLLFAVLLAIIAPWAARAASEPRILQWKSDGASLTLYVRHDDSASIREISVGGEKVRNAVVAPDASGTELVTWILYDCSQSMPGELRGMASEILDAFVRSQAPGETYRFCTYSDALRESDSFAAFKQRIGALQYDNESSDLTGALEEVLAQEAARDGEEFVRVVAISAGGGVPTEDAFQARLSEYGLSNIPIYAIDCGAVNSFSDLYALSVSTSARYWNIHEVGASDIANIMRWEEIPVRISLNVPEGVRAGTAREIEVRFSDRTSVRETVLFASADGAEEPPVEEETPTPETAPEPQSRSFPTGAVALAVTLFALIWAVVAFVLIRRKRRNATPAPGPVYRNPLSDGGAVPPSDSSAAPFADSGASPFANSGASPFANSGASPFADSGASPFANSGASPFANSGAAPLSGAVPNPQTPRADAPSDADDAFPTLYLSDIDRPEQRFRASLRNPVSVGRAANNVITLRYDTTISRRHCEIYLQNKELWVRDLGSTLGTYVGDMRAADAMKIPQGAVLRLGQAQYQVEVR